MVNKYVNKQASKHTNKTMHSYDTEYCSITIKQQTMTIKLANKSKQRNKPAPTKNPYHYQTKNTKTASKQTNKIKQANKQTKANKQTNQQSLKTHTITKQKKQQQPSKQTTKQKQTKQTSTH